MKPSKRSWAGGRSLLCLAFASILVARCRNHAFSMVDGAQSRSRQGSVAAAEADVHIADRAALSQSTLRECFTLRKPLPEAVLLHFPGQDVEFQRARLESYSSARSSINLTFPGDAGTLSLREESPSVWRVEDWTSDVPFPIPASTAHIYDATPVFQPSEGSHTTAESAPNVALHSISPSSSAGVAWNGMGFSPSELPRDFDGVHVKFAVWRCDGGSCRMQQEGEDDRALVCEFGPMKEGVLRMLPGETRRFWVDKTTEDRRFGRPVPERFLPNGDLVVDLTLLGIDREAVFEYKLSDAALEMRQLREQNPIIVAQRAVGVGVQLCAWALMYSYYQDPAGDPLQHVMGLSQAVHP